MPRSTAERNRDTISCLSPAGPYAKLMPMQPSPSADTSRPVVPRVRFCMCRASNIHKGAKIALLPLLRAVLASEIILALHLNEATHRALERECQAVAAIEVHRRGGGRDDEVHVTVV